MAVPTRAAAEVGAAALIVIPASPHRRTNSYTLYANSRKNGPARASVRTNGREKDKRREPTEKRVCRRENMNLWQPGLLSSVTSLLLHRGETRRPDSDPSRGTPSVEGSPTERPPPRPPPWCGGSSMAPASVTSVGNGKTAAGKCDRPPRPRRTPMGGGGGGESSGGMVVQPAPPPPSHPALPVTRATIVAFSCTPRFLP